MTAICGNVETSIKFFLAMSFVEGCRSAIVLDDVVSRDEMSVLIEVFDFFRDHMAVPKTALGLPA